MEEMENVIKEINKAHIDTNIPTKIKMKRELYDRIATEAQELTTGAEILDRLGQPLNTFNGLKVEIDNTIENAYELVY